MKKLRTSMILFVCVIGALYNIERLDFDQENAVNLDSFLYPLATIAGLLFLAMPRLSSLSFAVVGGFWILVYAALKVLAFRSHPPTSGLYTYLLITEITLFLAVLWTASRVARVLTEFERAVEEVTMQALGHRFIPLRDFGERIQDEFQLSRRLELPLSLLVVEPDDDSFKWTLPRILKEAQQSLIRVFANRSVASVITDTLRRTDLLLEDDTPGRFIILCRDTSAAGSEVVEQRILGACSRELGIKVTGGRACFPDDALTFEELLQTAGTRMKELTAEEPAAAAAAPPSGEAPAAVPDSRPEAVKGAASSALPSQPS